MEILAALALYFLNKTLSLLSLGSSDLIFIELSSVELLIIFGLVIILFLVLSELVEGGQLVPALAQTEFLHLLPAELKAE